MEALALRDDDRTPIEVRAVGRVLVADPLAPAAARALLAHHADPEVSDVEFRDRWLVVVTDMEDGALAQLGEAARHRLALGVLRVRGFDSCWRRLYGSPQSPAERLRAVVGDDLRRQAAPGRAPAVAVVTDLAPVRQASEALTRGAHTVVERINEAIAAPMRAIVERITEALAPALNTARLATDRLVRAPAFKQSLRFIDAYQRQVGEALRPMEALLRSRESAMSHFLHAPRLPEEATELPDATSLAAFYGQERGDPAWRTSEIGWLLAAVPLSIGAVVHERFGISPVTGLGWLAERFARHEMRRRLLRALDSLKCSDSLRQRLHDGADLFFRARYHSADSLLTAGLEGLLFELGEQQGKLTANHRLISDGKARGSKIKTAADGKLLDALWFNPSQKDYLAHYSIGQAGNPPRHGANAKFGSREHAAGTLLGIILVLAHAESDRRAIVGLLR